MKWISLLALLMVVFAFKPSEPCNRDFKVLSAQKQTFYGGVAGSPVVTVYKVTLQAKRKMLLTSDSAWAEDRIDQLVIDVDSFKTVNSHRVKRGETVHLRFENRSDSEIGGGDYQMKVPGSRQNKAPFDVKNGIVLSYKGGKSKTLVINNITTLETVFYP
jgi:hypothetical protein